MKARVKATRRIIQVMNVMDEKNITEPDYWEKLKHQAAISAMQGLLSNSAYLKSFEKNCVEGDHLARVVSRNAIDYATILVTKLKEESQCEK